VSAEGLDRLVSRLCRASGRFTPALTLDWPARLGGDHWFFSPELLSMAGTGAWSRLDEAERRRASLWEAGSFFSINVHGERRLIEGLAARLHQPRASAITPYLHHFLAEENDHMEYFGAFCTRYAGGVYAERKVAFPRAYAPGEEDVLFFARVLVFEEIVDRYNLTMARDERLHPLVRDIHAFHHRDESRHLAFGRRLVAELMALHAPTWTAETVTDVRESLWQCLLATLRELYSPDAYRDAGLDDPYELREEAMALPARRQREGWLAGPCLRFLQEHGLVEEGRELP
jgi:hypothetical protein